MGVAKGYKKHCVGCSAYKWAFIRDVSDKDVNYECRMHKKARGKCPCGSCLVKIMCGRYCDRFYEVQIDKNGIIL